MRTASVIVLVLFAFGATFGLMAPAKAETAVLYVSPEGSTFTTDTTPLFSRFNVTVWIANVSGLLGWQIDMRYNSTILSCTRAWHLTWDLRYPFYGRWTILDGPAFGSDWVLIADHPIPYDFPVFSGAAPLCIIEFQIIAEPPEGKTLSSVLDIADGHDFQTLLLGLTADEIPEIPCAKTNGYYQYIQRARTPMLGDLNLDGKVDLRDVAIACFSFGSTPNDARWDVRADVNHDSRIDLRDVAIIAKNFGLTAQ